MGETFNNLFIYLVNNSFKKNNYLRFNWFNISPLAHGAV